MLNIRAQNSTPTLVVPAPELAAPGMTAPAHGADGEGIMGLTPAPPISVAPSGTVPPSSRNVELVPGIESGEAAPLDDKIWPDGHPGVEFIASPAANPPPSNADAPPGALDIGIAEVLEAQLAVAAGLKPPGSISVAPSGRPVPPKSLEPGTPSGDVAPITFGVGTLIRFCARATPVTRTRDTARNDFRNCTSRQPHAN